MPAARSSSTLPLDLSLNEPGDHLVDVPITCVITRFGLLGLHRLLPTYLDYHRVMRDIKGGHTSGLLRSAFLIENPTTCYNLSIWANSAAIPNFGTNAPYHVEAARKVFRRVFFEEDRGPEVWSTKWRLIAVSNNLNWKDFNLRESILRTHR